MGEVLAQCPPSFLSSSVGSDPVNVGVIIVLVFFIVLIIAILGSFFLFRRKKKKYEKMQNRSLHTDSSGQAGLGLQGGRQVGSQGQAVGRHKKQLHSHNNSQQKPDVISEREVVAGHGSPVDFNDYSASMVMQEPDGPEHYDLENASSIAPSDIDVIYHYKGYREGGTRSSRDRWGRSHGDKMVSSSPIRLQSLQHGNTPLARLSPTSEMSHSQSGPRILTLQDISGKPLQSALLATQGPRGLTNISDSSASDLDSSSRQQRRQTRLKKKKPHQVSSSEDVSHNRNSSLVNSIDSGGRKSKNQKFNDLLETNTEMLQEDNSSSDSPSENDSFTCSEYDCETNHYEPKQMETPGNTSSGMVFRSLNNTTPGQGSLTTLNISDEELSGGFAVSPSGPTSWESLLNWSPNFNSFLGVFKDIAELPDLESDTVRPNPLGDREEEEYI